MKLKILCVFVIGIISSILIWGCSNSEDQLVGIQETEGVHTHGELSCTEQFGWRYCTNCKGLFWGPSTQSVCPSGDMHQFSEDHYDYALHYGWVNPPASIQVGWKFCAKCKGIFWGPSKYTSVCPLGGNHDDYNSATTYGILYQNDGTFSPVQAGWKYCNKCKTLFFGNTQSTSICPAGGTHDGTGSSTYYLKYR